MKSVKNYSKKKSRVQQKVKSKVKSRVQLKVQARIQARSNKKQINKQVSRKVNKRVNKNISRGTKKVKRNKNKKVTKKNLKSRVNVSEGGGDGKKKSLFRRFVSKFGRRRTTAEGSTAEEPPVGPTTMTGAPEVVQNPLPPVHTIFFDVDGTLSDAGCGYGTPNIKDDEYKELLIYLEKLKRLKVKLFILTRCNGESNICLYSQREYYKPIVLLMDDVYTGGERLDTDFPLGEPYYRSMDKYQKREQSAIHWAIIKSKFMEHYASRLNIEDKQKIVLIDDDYRNADMAASFGFRSFHNKKNESRIKGAALKMTNNVLRKIINSKIRTSRYHVDDSKFFQGTPTPTDVGFDLVGNESQKINFKLLEQEFEKKKINSFIAGEIENSRDKSRKRICSNSGKFEDFKFKQDDRFSSPDFTFKEQDVFLKSDEVQAEKKNTQFVSSECWCLYWSETPKNKGMYICILSRDDTVKPPYRKTKILVEGEVPSMESFFKIDGIKDKILATLEEVAEIYGYEKLKFISKTNNDNTFEGFGNNNTDYETIFDDNFDVKHIPSYTETGNETGTETGYETVNLEFIKFLESDIYSSDNRFDFSETELGPNEIIIHWDDKQKCLVVYCGFNNILDKKKKKGVGFPIGRVFSRTEKPSGLFNLSDEEIRQFKTLVVSKFNIKNLQHDKNMLEQEMSAKERNRSLSSEERNLYEIRLYKINTMLENINHANQEQSKITIKIKRRQKSDSTEEYKGFGTHVTPETSGTSGNNENNENNEFGFGNGPSGNKSGEFGGFEGLNGEDKV